MSPRRGSFVRKIVFASAAVLSVAIAWYVWQRVRGADDEAPIIVKNGSIEIETQDGEWKDGNTEWVNQSPGVNRDDLWVKVSSSTGTCRAIGKPVHVIYSQPNVHAIFTTSGVFSVKTRVGPKANLTFVDRKHLRAGSPGDGGHITEVRAQNLTCTLSPNSTNVEISICSSRDARACQ